MTANLCTDCGRIHTTPTCDTQHLHRADDPSMPLYWSCGYCHAPQGQQCTTTTGQPAPTHHDRHDAVRLWDRYGHLPVVHA